MYTHTFYNYFIILSKHNLFNTFKFIIIYIIIIIFSWSRNGQKLLSASTDNNVCTWDILSGEREEMYKFPSPVLKVQYHPRKKNLFLVCPMKHAAVLIDTEGNHKIVPLDEDVSFL